MTAPDPWPALLQGSIVDEYEIVDFLGGGGFGRVFEVVRTTDQSRWALKVLVPSQDPDAGLEFEREVELLGHLDGASNVVDAVGGRRTLSVPLQGPGGVLVTVDLNCVVLELAECAIDELICAPDDLSLQEKLRLWRAVVLGVHQMHTKLTVHRDLKSANCLVFMGRERERDGVKVSDLGRSRKLNEAAIHSVDEYLRGRGDLMFAPPEFIWWQGEDSEAAHRCADLYGLGSLLFELVVGAGFTATAIRPTAALMIKNHSDAQAGIRTDLSALAGQFEPAFKSFESALPSSIASELTSLLRVLCDPEPNRRLGALRARGGSHRLPPRSLEWLLRRADIVQRRASFNSKILTPRRQHAGH